MEELQSFKPKESNQIATKTFRFALRIVKAYKCLKYEREVYVLSKQLLRSGTSIGANVHEALYAQTRADFVTKMSISLKEASETLYWIELLKESDLFSEAESESLRVDCVEIIKMLTSIIKTAKTEQENK